MPDEPVWPAPSSGAASSSVAYDTPEAHGARRDGKLITDGAMTIGQPTLTSASGPFTAADVGKSILVQGAGNAAGYQTLVTTISGVSSATTATLAANAAATVAGAWAIYGTDDTTAINAAVAGAVANGQASNYYAEVRFTEGIYIVAGAPAQGGATQGNAQISLPIFTMTGRKFNLAFRGCADAIGVHYGQNSTPTLSGTVLVCARTDGTNSASFGEASMIGGPTRQVVGTSQANYTNLRPIIDGIQLVVPYPSTYCGFDFWGCVTATVKAASVQAFGSPTQMGNPFGNIVGVGLRYTFGLRTTQLADDGNVRVDQFQAAGLHAGMMIGEHVYLANGLFFYCNYGLFVFSDGAGGAMTHTSRASYVCSEASGIGQMGFDTTGSLHIDVDTLDVDTVAPAVYDPNNVGRGTVTVRGAGGGENKPSITGAGYMRIVNGDQVPGTGSFAAQPTLPATATAFKNPYYRDAFIYLTGGTVSSVQLSGTPAGTVTLGVTSGLVVLPAGMSITINYTVAPTWFWMIR